MNTEHIRNVKEATHGMFLNNLYDTVEVGIGFKQIAGNFTDEKCIRFGVKEKLPLDQLVKEKIIPSSMSIDGVIYKTDVYSSPHEAKILILVKPEYEVTATTPSSSSASSYASVIFYIDGTPVLGPKGTTQQYWDDETNHCAFWHYTNNNTEPVQVTWTFCRNYTYTTIILPTITGWYAWVPVGYTPPDFPGMIRDEGPIETTIIQSDCCSEPGFWASNSVSPRITPHRSKHRPLVGGISMGAPPPTGNVVTGTLGGIVIDSTDGKMVGLTNNHVCANPGGNVNLCKFFASDSYYATDSDFRTINNYQPGSLDSLVVNKVEDKVGITKRAFPLTSTGTNYVDCGIVNLTNDMVDTNSWDNLGSNFTSAPPFATTAEIDALTSDTEIFKSSRTTGPIRLDMINEFPAAKPCNIRITQTSTSVNVSGFGSDNALIFADLLRFESPFPDNTVPGLGGDSGSLVYAKIGGVWKIIGLFFAGNQPGEEKPAGWACRIDRVANLLKIEAYTGTPVDANPNTPSYITLDLPTYGSQASIVSDGKTYWQVGVNV